MVLVTLIQIHFGHKTNLKRQYWSIIAKDEDWDVQSNAFAKQYPPPAPIYWSYILKTDLERQQTCNGLTRSSSGTFHVMYTKS
jgi:hypothetical protein